MPRKTPGPPCLSCGAPSVAKGYCDKHYRRFTKFGHVEGTSRPPDWGKREKHPLNELWRWTGRKGRVHRWNDFWLFVADVGPRPEGQRLRRYNTLKPWGPDNFYWKEPLTGTSYTTANAEGKKQYQRDWRKANPLLAKANHMRKTYGIELADYDAMRDAQDGKCAICKEPQPLCVDHCHDTGKVRGLLCHLCNRALGLFNDDALRLQSAIAYLAREAA
jgi:hypothetical protein